jgi:dolichol-phosphate mannosyltransferase
VSMAERRAVVVLPAFNEGAAMEAFIRKVDAEAARLPGFSSYRILVCDDGSHDDTADVARRLAEELDIEVLTHKLNRGLGETIRDLFERAAEIVDDDDVVIRMDCDNTHEPRYMAPMIRRLDEGYDVVIASRFQPGGGQHGLSPYRRLISRAATMFMRTLFPIDGVREYTCGYRAYRGAIIRSAIRHYGNNFIQLGGLGFTCSPEKLLKLHLVGARFAEVPFELRYDQKESSSKMLSSLTTFGYLVMAVLYHWPWGGWRSARRPIAVPTDPVP